MTRRPTIIDVAELAGVSESAAARALADLEATLTGETAAEVAAYKASGAR